MLKLLLPMTMALTFATFALQPTSAKAECNADHYLQDAVTATNKELGEQIDCLAKSLQQKGAAITENDRKTAEKIIRLSFKIIGNGSAASALQRDSDAAKKIACFASGYLSGPSVAPDLLKYKDTCPGIDDAKQEILVTNKIIGNV